MISITFQTLKKAYQDSEWKSLSLFIIQSKTYNWFLVKVLDIYLKFYTVATVDVEKTLVKCEIIRVWVED